MDGSLAGCDERLEHAGAHDEQLEHAGARDEELVGAAARDEELVDADVHDEQLEHAAARDEGPIVQQDYQASVVCLAQTARHQSVGYLVP